MGGTVIKYEFLRTWKVLAIAAGALLGLQLIAIAAAFWLPGVAVLPYFLGFALALLFPFAVQLYLAVDFHRSAFGRRGYLTHTLPVQGRTLVLATFAFALLATLAATAWAFLCLRLALVAGDELGILNWEAVRLLIEVAFDDLGALGWGMMLFVAFSTLVGPLAQYWFSVTVGAEAWINKSGGLGPVVTFLILYTAVQIASVISFAIPPSYQLETGQWDWGIPLVDLVTNPDTAGMPVALFGLLVLAAVWMLWRAVVSVERELELR